MAHARSRFVLLCQQSLAFGLVVAVAAPAANMVTLDIVAPPVPTPGAASSAATRSVVATTPVRPTVDTVPLTGVDEAGVRALRAQPTSGAGSTAGSGSADGVVRLAAAPTATRVEDLTVLSAPQPVHGLATIGVTWSSGDPVGDQAISIAVRSRTDGTWSEWEQVPYHVEEGPDAGSTEGRAARPGTDPMYVGRVDDVQVKATADSGRPPTGMALALVDPGSEPAPAVEEPAIDTGAGATTSDAPAAPDPDGDASLSAATLAAGRVTHRPTIYSRRQWGADERMRDASSLHYGEVHGGFVHHTVNANTYTRKQVPSIIRGIYAYHTQSRGWSDVGYNFLVDRFGRIWEGRYGGVRRPVVGAHTLGFNDDSFAGSAIGNFDIARPPGAVVRAFGRLFAWKLSLHGVRARARHQLITSRRFRAVSGHRDAGSTACPGRYLYAKLPRIRNLAAAHQRWAGRERRTSVAGSRTPVIVARDRGNGRAYLIRTTRSGRFARVTATGARPALANLILNVGDWNGSGRGDVITRSGKTGQLYLYRGLAGGRLRDPRQMSRASFARVRFLTAVGDMTGDGRPDLLGQPRGRSMRIYPGDGRHGFGRSYVAHSGLTGRKQLGVGLWNRDGAPDTVLLRRNRRLVLYPGNGPGGLTGGRVIRRLRASYDWVLAVGDLTGDNRADLVARSSRTHRTYTIPGVPGGFAKRRLFATGLGRFDLAG